MTDKRYIKYKIQDLLQDKINNMTKEEIQQQLKQLDDQYYKLRDTQFKSLSDCKTLEEIDQHVKYQFEMFKIEAMFEKYHFELQYK